MSAPVEFRVYPLREISLTPEDREYYWRVQVFNTTQEMRDSVTLKALDVSTILAACASSKGEGYRLGDVYFSRDRLSSGIVAHEMVHAGFRTAERCDKKIKHWAPLSKWRFLNPVGPVRAVIEEEFYASVVETLNAQFWREAYARGLAEPG